MGKTRKIYGGAKTSEKKKVHVLGNKSTLQWMTEADLNKKITVHGIGNVEEKKYKVTLNEESPEKGQKYTGNLVVKSATSSPEAEVELRDEAGEMKIFAVYFDMAGAKYEQELVQPLERVPVPARFALIKDEEVEMSFVMAKAKKAAAPAAKPLIAAATFGATAAAAAPAPAAAANADEEGGVNPYSISYNADVYVDANGMRPFVWYLNMMKLKMPVYLVKPGVEAVLEEVKVEEPHNFGRPSGALGGINKAAAYARMFSANNKAKANPLASLFGM